MSLAPFLPFRCLPLNLAPYLLPTLLLPPILARVACSVPSVPLPPFQPRVVPPSDPSRPRTFPSYLTCRPLRSSRSIASLSTPRPTSLGSFSPQTLYLPAAGKAPSLPLARPPLPPSPQSCRSRKRRGFVALSNRQKVSPYKYAVGVPYGVKDTAAGYPSSTWVASLPCVGYPSAFIPPLSPRSFTRQHGWPLYLSYQDMRRVRIGRRRTKADWGATTSAVSADDLEPDPNPRKRKKRYHRPTPQQIQELEM